MANRKIIQAVTGIVVTDKMNQTRVIEIQRDHTDRLYKKKRTRQNRLFIHDEKNVSKVGDKVMAASTRPLSHNKSHRLVRVLVEGVRS